MCQASGRSRGKQDLFQAERCPVLPWAVLHSTRFVAGPCPISEQRCAPDRVCGQSNGALLSIRSCPTGFHFRFG